ncbi:MAG: single-stranded-DNA-specific exonuclease RecJ [Anaerolineales bacterium]
MPRWLDPPAVDIPASFADLSLPPLIAQTLIRRGFGSPAAARAFLHPEDSPSTPFPAAEQAAALVHMAIRKKQRVGVWGDFDVDGQTATALLVQTLQALGADVVYYIPIRGKENHGVHIESLKPLLDGGVSLLITCDTGIAAHEAIAYAQERGVDVIITDHHDPKATSQEENFDLPNARTILNPKLLPAEHPLRHLAGVGVAYKLAEALLAEQPAFPPEHLHDLAALGLIADVALLVGETRALVKRGIRRLRNTSRLGLRVMAEMAGAALETLTEETIGFTFAPRLNALGRLGDANPAVELLLTSNAARAQVLATQVEGLNAQRQLLTHQVYQAAEALLQKDPALLDEPIIVLAHPHWPGGVVGIVANKLVDRYHKPAILLSEGEDGILRGSARSIEGVHITEAIATQKDLLLGFGGHPMAAGMSLEAGKLTEFRRGVGKAVETQLRSRVQEEAALQIDAWLGFDEVHLPLAESLELLSPFGAGNPLLIFATRNVKLQSAVPIGKTREHLRLQIEDENGHPQSLLWWGGAGETLPETESRFDVAYSVRATSYRGQQQVTLQFEAFRIVEAAPIEIERKKIAIIDWRAESRQKIETLPPNVLVWAEGEHGAKGIPRFALQAAEVLAIYTAPPSLADLRKALQVVHPQQIYVFAVCPAEEKPPEFLKRLAGLCKFALNQKSGRTSLPELTAAMAAREAAVEIGLDWLAAGGHLSASMDEGGAILLSAGQQEKNPYLQAELFVALRGILAETAAYRTYFAETPDLEGMLTQ